MTSSANVALRVVAIDDDVQHLKFISTVLSSKQVVVSTAADPGAGLGWLERCGRISFWWT
jgi:DNA-binding response OmpR family regulator